jgi:hypothetical protein
VDPNDTASNVVAFPARGERPERRAAPAFSCVAAHRSLTLMLYWSARGQHEEACGEIRTRIIRGRWHGQLYMPLSEATCRLVENEDFEAAVRHLDELFRHCIGQ